MNKGIILTHDLEIEDREEEPRGIIQIGDGNQWSNNAGRFQFAGDTLEDK